MTVIFSEGEDVSLVCSSEGARPAAVLAWYNGTRYNLVEFGTMAPGIWNMLVKDNLEQFGTRYKSTPGIWAEVHHVYETIWYNNN